MNLDTIPNEVWNELAAVAKQAAASDVRSRVRQHFYSQIYSTWSQGKVNYDQNQDLEVDAGWKDLVLEWFNISRSSKSLTDELGDDSVGRASVQWEEGPDKIKMARMWERYNDGKGDRFQFVVNAGGGMVLFNRMRRACQTYIIEHLHRKVEDSVVKGWKVFGEEGGTDRSDSCVVYLACAWTDARLAVLISDFIWPNIKDLVDSDFKPLGFYAIDKKPLWAMPMPDRATERAVLGTECKGSAGGLMSSVLGLAFQQAAAGGESDAGKLAAQARQNARDLVKKLYPA